jgi:hypothetical protein
MLNKRSKIALATGVMLTITALTTVNASARAGHVAGNSMGAHQAPTMSGQVKAGNIRGISVTPRPGTVTGLKLPPGKVTGITLPPGKVTGIVKPPGKVTGIVIPPGKVTGIVIPPGKVTGIVIPPGKVIGIVIPPKNPPIVIPPIVVEPPAVIAVPPVEVVTQPVEVVTPQRRFPWYEASTVPARQTVVTQTEAPCTCLSKEYLQDGSVLFKDNCTKESALLSVEEMRAKQQGASNQNQ